MMDIGGVTLREFTVFDGTFSGVYGAYTITWGDADHANIWHGDEFIDSIAGHDAVRLAVDLIDTWNDAR